MTDQATVSTPEPFSPINALKSFVSGLDYFKSVMQFVKLAIIAGVVASPFVIYHSGVKKGDAAGFIRGYSQAIKEHPPVTITGNGATINNNVDAKRGFRACIYPLTFGW